MSKPSIRTVPYRALFVDDEPAVLEMYREIFETANEVSETEVQLREIEDRLAGRPSDRPAQPPVDAVFCAQAEEAVEAVRRAVADRAPFCVVFLDVRMPPGPDGVWAAEQIRRLDPDVEIVIVTAYSDVDPVDIVRRAPPAERLIYLQKPFRPSEVRQLFRALAGRWDERHRQRTELEALRRELEEARQKAALEEAARKQAQPLPAPRRLRLATEMAHGFLLAISEEGELIEVGPGVRRVLGLPPSTLRGKTLATLFVRPADAKAMMVALAVQGI